MERNSVLAAFYNIIVDCFPLTRRELYRFACCGLQSVCFLHQCLDLRPSRVSEKVGTNKQNLNKKLYTH